MPTVLGSSGLAVSRMGLGLAALGRPGYINLGHASDLAGRTQVASLERLTHNVLDAAYEWAKRTIDELLTADNLALSTMLAYSKAH